MTSQADTPTKRWAVIGGGVLGLRLAERLAGAGQRVTLFEAAPEIGGLAGAWTLGVQDGPPLTWDKHYHVTLLSDLRTRSLLETLGLKDDLRWVETKTGFYTDGRLHSMSNSLEFLRFPPLGLIDKLRLALTILHGSRITDPAPLERVLVGDWLRKWSGRRTFEKIWEPLLLAKLGEAYKRCSAAFIWATIARMYKARQTGMKKEMFGYARGGYARVLERYGDHLASRGVRVATNAPVEQVTPADGRVEVAVRGGVEAYDRVVFTTPSPVITRVCPMLGKEELERHQSVEYLGVVCASVVLDKPISPYYVTNITDRGAPFTAVIEMTALVDPAEEFGGRHLVYLPRYAAQDDPIWQASDAEVEAAFIAALDRRYPDFDPGQVRAFRVSRAPHVMALPTLGYTDRLPPMKTAAPGVFAVNSTHITRGTLNVNETLELADNAFDRVLSPESEDSPAPQPAAC